MLRMLHRTSDYPLHRARGAQVVHEGLPRCPADRWIPYVKRFRWLFQIIWRWRKSPFLLRLPFGFRIPAGRGVTKLMRFPFLRLFAVSSYCGKIESPEHRITSTIDYRTVPSTSQTDHSHVSGNVSMSRPVWLAAS